MNSKLIIIDISSFIFRAFYAIRPLHSPEGTPVNAVHGVLSMLLKLLENHSPSHVLVARDSKGPSFRHEIYPEYKANRSEAPEELIPQFDLITELLEQMQLPHIGLDRYEADDIIGSLCVQWKGQFEQILVASSDKDLMQFVDDKVQVLDTMKDKIYDREGVFAKMGVWPEQVVDYLSMLGDSSDNIPGMKGIGAKGAGQLLATYQTLEKCIENADKLTNKRLQNAFANHLDDAHLSKELITIPTDLKLALEPDDAHFKFYPSTDLVSFLKGLGFKTLVKKIEGIKYTSDHEDSGTNEQHEFVAAQSDRPQNYHLVGPDQFDDFFQRLQGEQTLAIESCFCARGYLYPIIALAISFDGKQACYLPISHSGDEDLLGGEIPNLTGAQLKKLLGETACNPQKTLLGNQLKQLFAHCYFNNLKVSCQYADNLLGNYVSNSAHRSDTETLAAHFLEHEVNYKEGKNDDYGDYEMTRLMDMACEKVILNFRLHTPLQNDLAQRDLDKIYHDIEVPLTPILAELEANGVQLNQGHLHALEDEYTVMLLSIQDEIERECGESINLNSPKQVAFLLFEKLNLPTRKKLKQDFPQMSKFSPTWMLEDSLPFRGSSSVTES